MSRARQTFGATSTPLHLSFSLRYEEMCLWKNGPSRGIGDGECFLAPQFRKHSDILKHIQTRASQEHGGRWGRGWAGTWKEHEDPETRRSGRLGG